MQDRYSGDVGDFIKLGLLRHLAAATDTGGAGLRLGLNWYLAPDEAHNADGKHTAYLSHPHTSLAACDPDLFERLARVVTSERSVTALEACGALPAGSATHSERLDPSAGLPGRRRWHHRALAALAGSEVVCTDPDNGLAATAKLTKPHKYALLGELRDYARRGQSLVAYQHADRSTVAELQCRRRLDQLATGVRQAPVSALVCHRGSCRFFLVTADETHRARLTHALAEFARRWSPHVELIRS